MNVSLTEYEMQLVIDGEVLLAKNRIIQSVCNLFGNLTEEYKNETTKTFLADANLINAKISRGENYQGLPYVILDFPRQFGKTDVLAIRSFFWWGNFFSITLHLQGIYQQRYAGFAESAISNHVFDGWYIASSSAQWQHHFDNENYRLLNNSDNYALKDLTFLKLAKKIPLEKWDDANNFFAENFKLLISVLSGYAPIL